VLHTRGCFSNAFYGDIILLKPFVDIMCVTTAGAISFTLMLAVLSACDGSKMRAEQIAATTRAAKLALPYEATFVEDLDSYGYGKWFIVKIRNDCFLYRQAAKSSVMANIECPKGD
jgi:hypothetical protein